MPDGEKEEEEEDGLVIESTALESDFSEDVGDVAFLAASMLEAAAAAAFTDFCAVVLPDAVLEVVPFLLTPPVIDETVFVEDGVVLLIVVVFFVVVDEGFDVVVLPVDVYVLAPRLPNPPSVNDGMPFGPLYGPSPFNLASACISCQFK